MLPTFSSVPSPIGAEDNVICIPNEIAEGLARNELLSLNLHGFVGGESCLTNLLSFLTDVSNRLIVEIQSRYATRNFRISSVCLITSWCFRSWNL